MPGRHNPGLQRASLSLAQIRGALAEAILGGEVLGLQEWEQLAAHLRREVTGRISELDRPLGAFSG